MPWLRGARTVGIVVALLSTGARALAMDLPRRLVWRGTVATVEGYAGIFTARGRLIEGRDLITVFEGRFRCRGLGCPWRSGSAEIYPGGVFPRDAIGLVLLGGARAIYCVYDNHSPPGRFAIDGPYVCYTLAPPFPLPSHVASQGTMKLNAATE